MDVGYLFDVIVCGGICKNDDRYDTVDPKHKVFLCHNGAQKDFVEQFCVDLKRWSWSPFFDKLMILAYQLEKTFQTISLLRSKDVMLEWWFDLNKFLHVRHGQWWNWRPWWNKQKQESRDLRYKMPVFYRISKIQWNAVNSYHGGMNCRWRIRVREKMYKSGRLLWIITIRYIL